MSPSVTARRSMLAISASSCSRGIRLEEIEVLSALTVFGGSVW
jgi:hypothetical protein